MALNQSTPVSVDTHILALVGLIFLLAHVCYLTFLFGLFLLKVQHLPLHVSMRDQKMHFFTLSTHTLCLEFLSTHGPHIALHTPTAYTALAGCFTSKFEKFSLICDICENHG